MSFDEVLTQVCELLHRQGRVSYRALKLRFGIDDNYIDGLKDELIYAQHVARDKDNRVLVWIGEAEEIASPPPQTSQQPAAQQDHPSQVTPPSTEPHTPEAERRQLTVMFCDLVDSTKLSSQLDPEDYREVVRAYQATCTEVIQRYDGHIAQYLGDGLLVYFGWPQAHEDDTQRGVHAGLGIVEAITTTLNPRLEQEKGIELAVRIGIHTGPVVVGEMGGGGRHESLATGETVNFASRLEGLAAPNTLVISHVTARLVRSAFVLKDLGTHNLRGVAEPIQVFRVVGPGGMDQDTDETMARAFAALVGRDEEIELLLRLWEQSKGGLGQVVLVSGEAGIGKSALVEALRTQVRAEGLTRIAFRCSPYHQNSVLYPVITHVEHLLHFERDDAPAVKLDKLEQVLQSYSFPLEEVLPLFAAMLSVPLNTRYRPLSLTPQQQKQQTLDALVAWLVEEAKRQPVLVVWEDLHWSDPSTQDMLGLIIEQSPTVPMLSVLTFRPEFPSPWPIRTHITPITLNRLERSQVEVLIMQLAGGKVLPVEVIQHIIAKTDGVPLYAEELTKMLLESDLLREEADQYVLTGRLLTVAIPDTLQDSLMARLDQFNTAKQVAQLGAVLGREFSYEMLRAIWPRDEETVQIGLAQLVEAGLLYQRERPPRAKYIFKHALIQDAAYASLLRRTRQRVHQQVAQLLKEKFPEMVETQPELAAHHYTKAELKEQAVEYWQQAGERSVARSAHLEAIAHFTMALEVLAGAPDGANRSEHELSLCLALGRSWMARKGYAAPEVEHVYARARELCRQVGETPRLLQVMLGLMTFYFVRASLQTARELGEECLRLAQHSGDTARLQQVHLTLGNTLCNLGELSQARDHLQQGIALYRRQQSHPRAVQDPGVACNAYGALVLWVLGYPEQALERSHAALALAQELSHPLSRVYALMLAATVHQHMRDALAVHECTEAGMAVSTEQEFLFWQALGTVLRGWLLVKQGQGDEGIAQIGQGIDAWRLTGAEMLRPYLLGIYAEAYGNVGQVDMGLACLDEALEVTDKHNERLHQADLHRLKGELLLQHRLPDLERAETRFHQAIAISRHQQAKSWELRAATSLARWWQHQGKRKEAYDLLAPVYGWFTEGFDTADLKDAKVLLDELSESP